MELYSEQAVQSGAHASGLTPRSELLITTTLADISLRMTDSRSQPDKVLKMCVSGVLSYRWDTDFTPLRDHQGRLSKSEAGED